MDTLLLARLAVEVLVSHVKDTRTSVDEFQKRGERLYDVIRNRFARETDGGKASNALQLFEKDPKQRKGVEDELFPLLETDQTFAKDLRTTLQVNPPQKKSPHEEIETRSTRLSAAFSTSYQQIKAGKSSTVENIRMSIKND